MTASLKGSNFGGLVSATVWAGIVLPLLSFLPSTCSSGAFLAGSSPFLPQPAKPTRIATATLIPQPTHRFMHAGMVNLLIHEDSFVIREMRYRACAKRGQW